ncbi:alpha/beta-hydrolase [Epithele typhae]|uniref:alpha/beta-hydrolase n=1 Tax=Epithele typhae TaxID=378194 RepID=UPI0020078C14|nr:alpha/beta-hydrolase [Epithele typhae]KAH9917665.1 alpha/beta-hydrolase [Epithele typhae]
MRPQVRTPRSTDGTHIHAEAVGDPRNPHVVFIHEATLSAQVFDGLFDDPRLTDYLFIAGSTFLSIHRSLTLFAIAQVRYDLRCHGRSGCVRSQGDQLPSLYAADFAAVADAFGLHKPIVVAWCASSSVVADLCAHLQPPSFTGLVAIAPSLDLGHGLGHTFTARGRALIDALRTTRDAAACGRTKTDFVDAILSPGERTADAVAMRAAWLGRSVAQDAEETAALLSRPCSVARLLDAGRRGLPMLLLVGAADAVVDGAAVVRGLSGHFRNTEAHVLAEAGHALFVDRRDEFVRLLLVFVGRLAVMKLMH